MSAPDVLPLCTTREVRGRVLIEGVWHVPCFCMNCHVQDGFATEMEGPDPGYVGYLCDACAARWAPVVGVMLTPNEVRARRARESQLEAYGRDLTPAEMLAELADGGSALSRIIRSA